MRFKFNIKDKYVWNDWFAWRPVKMGRGEWVWLETIQRRRYGSCKNYNWIYLYKGVE